MNKLRHPCPPPFVTATTRDPSARPFTQRVQLLATRLEITQFEALGFFAMHFGMQTMGPQELARFQPDFDLASLAECQRRGCILGFDRERPTTLVLLAADPEQVAAQEIFETHFEGQTRAWVQRALALRSDFDALLNAPHQADAPRVVSTH